ncbi:MAG: ABC transporter ATP-binding protein [SAR324 cluster bacterium]|nr:ABC transporter ATP-binding protein [SAR324 cluster bacterium]MCH8887411.1 ABC transporter ATP-binding protein [SAR324 cluster bacterium]
MTPMLTMEDVHGAYGPSEAVHGVNLHIDEGEVVCIVGRNGAGKTSTFRCIVQDMIRVTKGSVRFKGQELAGLPPHRVVQMGIGYVPEDRRVFPTLSVMENLIVPRPMGSGKAKYWTIQKVFELFPPLEEFKSRLAGNLSGGQQQMLSIARSLLIDPVLLLLDEPHEGLAPLVAREVVNAIRHLKSTGVSLLLSEQHLHLVKDTADRIYVVDRGITVFDGTMEQFEQDPEIAKKYLMVVRQES